MEQKIKLEISYQTIFKVILVVLFVLLLFYVNQTILALFTAFVISTITNPLADWAEKKNIPRAISAPFIFVGIFVFIGLMFYLIIPTLAGELSDLAKRFPDYITMNTAKYPILEQYNIKGNIDNTVLTILDYIRNEALNLLLSTVSVLSNLFYIFLAFAIAFYLTVEKNLVKKYLKLMTDHSHHDDLARMLGEIEIKMGRWFMGQIILSLTSGAAIFLGLTILDVPFALPLAVLASILRFIPYLGGLISDTTGILIALLTSPALGIAAFLMYYLIQQIESYILIPYVMSKTVGLNPIVVIITVVVGGQLGGIIGALLAIPITIILVILVKEFVLKEKTV